MPTYKIDAHLFPATLDAYIHDFDTRNLFIMGPLGSGKTYASLIKLMQWMQIQEPNAQGVRPTRFLAIRNTYPDLMGTTVKDFQAMFDPMGDLKMGGLEPPTFKVGAKLSDGTRIQSEVIFLALDRDDAVKKVRGYQLTGAWLNETKELSKSVVDMVDLRHGRFPSRASAGVDCTHHGMIGDTNAPDDDSWYYHLAEVERPEGWRFLRQPGGLIPTGKKQANGKEIFEPNDEAENLENLPEGYYERGQRGKTDDWIRVNLCNEYGFLVEGRPVHPEYVDSVHCATEDIPFDPDLPIILGIDFGRTPAAAVIQFQRQWGRFVAVDELVSHDMSQQLFAPELRVWLNTNFNTDLSVDMAGLVSQSKEQKRVRGWCDPAGEAKSQATEDTPRLILNAHGVPVLPAPSNSPTLRRTAISEPLRRLCMDGRPALIISPKCKMLRKGLMGGYCFRKMKVAGTDRYTDQPDKTIYSHIVEALEYALLGEGEGLAQMEMADPDDYGDASAFQEFAIFD